MKLGPVGEGHSGGSAIAGDDALDRRFQGDLGAERLGGLREELGESAVASLVEGPGPELAVVLTDRVVQQHKPGSLRPRPDLGADDRRRRDVALHDIRVEVVIEEVGGAPC